MDNLHLLHSVEITLNNLKSSGISTSSTSFSAYHSYITFERLSSALIVLDYIIWLVADHPKWEYFRHTSAHLCWLDLSCETQDKRNQWPLSQLRHASSLHPLIETLSDTPTVRTEQGNIDLLVSSIGADYAISESAHSNDDSHTFTPGLAPTSLESWLRSLFLLHC